MGETFRRGRFLSAQVFGGVLPERSRGVERFGECEVERSKCGNDRAPAMLGSPSGPADRVETSYQCDYSLVILLNFRAHFHNIGIILLERMIVKTD